MRRGLTILMYHRILPSEQCIEYPLESLVIPSDVFQKQMQWLAGHCNVMPAREAIEALATGRPFKKPLVAVTFDDGYADNFEVAAPILETQGLRGTFFITSGFVADGAPLWYDRAADAWQRMSHAARKGLARLNSMPSTDIRTWMAWLKQAAPDVRINLVEKAESLAGGSISRGLYRPMSIKQVTALSKRGHEIGSHTVTHPILPQLDDALLKDELERSAQHLSEWTGTDVIGFCYPNGDLDERVERAVLDAGYQYACAMHSGFNRRAVLTRLARLPITMQRTVRGGCTHDALGFRAELCRFRDWIR
ncbi:MAG: hypothetical protein VR64_23850 [Desulfatitalea sp. BRH_c12]|nr:MAG: hypothetical protein VR64_23850 [Desulfatitalea sp. BRH_c12]